MNYTKRPVTIQAWQLTKENIKAGLPDWFDHNKVSIFNGKKAMAEVETFEGVLDGEEGDFIIRGSDGEFYPCNPDIFEKTYMPDLNIEDYIDRIRALANNRDTEGTHIEADKILCEVLKTLGQGELVEEFEKLEKWYA